MTFSIKSQPFSRRGVTSGKLKAPIRNSIQLECNSIWQAHRLVRTKYVFFTTSCFGGCEQMSDLDNFPFGDRSGASGRGGMCRVAVVLFFFLAGQQWFRFSFVSLSVGFVRPHVGAGYFWLQFPPDVRCVSRLSWLRFFFHWSVCWRSLIFPRCPSFILLAHVWRTCCICVSCRIYLWLIFSFDLIRTVSDWSRWLNINDSVYVVFYFWIGIETFYYDACAFITVRWWRFGCQNEQLQPDVRSVALFFGYRSCSFFSFFLNEINATLFSLLIFFWFVRCVSVRPCVRVSVWNNNKKKKMKRKTRPEARHEQHPAGPAPFRPQFSLVVSGADRSSFGSGRGALRWWWWTRKKKYLENKRTKRTKKRARRRTGNNGWHGCLRQSRITSLTPAGR